MKDQILKSYVDGFCSNYGIEKLKDSEQFEHFVNFCVTSKQYPRDFDFDKLSVGGSDDIGLDGAAFIVNGNIVQSPEEITYLLEKNGYLDVSFVFIQTKKSQKFKGDQVGTIVFGIKSFFDDVASIPENNEIKNLRLIKDEIYKNTLYLEDAPRLNIFFATTGEWKEPEHITGRVSRELRDLDDKKLFSKIDFHYYDADKLKQAYREINRKTVKEINFSNYVSLPDIDGVRQAFVGSIPVKEYIKLISDSENKLQKNLFEDNVRDFQGKNKVNREIGRTLSDPKEQAALSVFNNGITIIAKKVEPISNKMKLTDFQIVNGCQSSHVLFENRAKLLEGTHITLKVIDTTDYEFATKVVKATNRQTEVTDEAFESLSPFHKNLEEFYKSQTKTINNPTFYERRSKQYDGLPGVRPSQVISLSTQISSYVAAHLAQPQSTHRYYGELLESNRGRMFRDEDSLECYYISSLILNRIEQAFRSNVLDRKYKGFKFHILHLSYQFYLVKKRLNKDYGYKDIINELDCLESCSKVFKAALLDVRSSLKSMRISTHDAIRSKSFTEDIKAKFEKQITNT